MARGNRIFAGPRLRQLRLDHRMDQATMAQALGISVSYLSQLENDDRPLTAKVKAAVASAFPTDWASFDSREEEQLLGAFTYALAHPELPGTLMEPERIEKLHLQFPEFAARYVDLYNAHMRANERINMIEEAIANDTADGFGVHDVTPALCTGVQSAGFRKHFCCDGWKMAEPQAACAPHALQHAAAVAAVRLPAELVPAGATARHPPVPRVPPALARGVRELARRLRRAQQLGRHRLAPRARDQHQPVRPHLPGPLARLLGPGAPRRRAGRGQHLQPQRQGQARQHRADVPGDRVRLPPGQVRYLPARVPIRAGRGRKHDQNRLHARALRFGAGPGAWHLILEL